MGMVGRFAVPLTRLHHLVIGAVIAIVVAVPLGVFAFVESGFYNVGASSPHTKFTEWLTHETMIHSVRRRSAAVAATAGFSPAEVDAGFCAYDVHCVACHGASAVPRAQWAAGIEPAPPYLLDESRRFTPRQLFWIVKNGIKMTGMPAWRGEMSDEEISSVVAWLEVGPKLPPQTYVQWRESGRCGPAKPSPFPG